MQYFPLVCLLPHSVLIRAPFKFLCLGDHCITRQRKSRNKWDVALPWPIKSRFKVTFGWYYKLSNSTMLYFRKKKKNVCVKVVWFPIRYKWQGWNENSGLSVIIHHQLSNPIIRYSRSSILEKLSVLRVIITIQHANCFSIRRLYFQWVLLGTTVLHLKLLHNESNPYQRTASLWLWNR